MARLEDRLSEKSAGDFYVDSSCIDCSTCRIIAPEVYGSLDRGYAYVQAQPRDEAEERRALMALIACPTSSIGAVGRSARAVVREFPEPIAGDVHYCGFASESSYGASSYLVRRPDGNVLVDSPRGIKPLLDRIEELGGVAMMFLTHRDDVADHDLFRERFGCERILHLDDVTRGTRAVERKLEGREPVSLAEDLLAIPVPGHTRGSMALLHGDVLFTGDHLWAREGTGELHASRRVCWYDWSEQLDSLERLLAYEFAWVLPGHGHRRHAEPPRMRDELARLLQTLRQRDQQGG